jgi:hypothetical protein
VASSIARPLPLQIPLPHRPCPRTRCRWSAGGASASYRLVVHCWLAHSGRWVCFSMTRARPNLSIYSG